MKKFLGILLSLAMLLSIVPVSLTTGAVAQTVYTVKSDFENQDVSPWGNPFGTAPAVAAGAAKNGSYGLESAGRFQANFAAGEGEGKIQPGVMNDIRFWARTAEGTSGLEVQVYYNLSVGGANSLRVCMTDLYSIGSDWTDVRMNFNLYINEQNELVAVWRRPDMAENATQVLTTVATGAYITSFDVVVLTSGTAYFDDITISSEQDISADAPVYGNVYACNEDFEDQATVWAGAFGGTAAIDAAAAKNGSYGLKANSRFQTNFAAGAGEGKILPGVMNTMEFSMKANAGVTNGFYVLMYVNGTSGLLFDGLQLCNGSSPLNGDNWVDFSLEFCLYINEANQLYAKWRRTDMTGYTEQPLTGTLAEGTEITSFDIVFNGVPEVCVDDIKIYSQQEIVEPESEEIIDEVTFEDGTAGTWHSSGSATQTVLEVGGDFGKVLKSELTAGQPWNRLQANYAVKDEAGHVRVGKNVQLSFAMMAPAGVTGSYSVQLYINTDVVGGIQTVLGENIPFTAGAYSQFNANFTLEINNGSLDATIKRHNMSTVLNHTGLATGVGAVNSIDIVILSDKDAYYVENIKLGYNLEADAVGTDYGTHPDLTVSGGEGDGEGDGDGGEDVPPPAPPAPPVASTETKWDFEDGELGGWTGGINNTFAEPTIVDDATAGGKVLKVTKQPESAQVRAQIQLAKDVFAFDKTYTIREKLRLKDGETTQAATFLFVSTVEKGDYSIVIDEINLNGARWTDYEAELVMTQPDEKTIKVEFVRSNGIRSSGTIVGDTKLTLTGFYLTYFGQNISELYVDDIEIAEKAEDSDEKVLEIKNGDFSKGNIWWDGAGYSDFAIVDGGKEGAALNVVAKPGAVQNRAQYYLPAADIKDGQYYHLEGYAKAADGITSSVQTMLIVFTSKGQHGIMIENVGISDSKWSELNTYFQPTVYEDAIEINYCADGETYLLWGTETAQGETLEGIYFVTMSSKPEHTYLLDEFSVAEIEAPKADEEDKGEEDNEGNVDNKNDGTDEDKPAGGTDKDTVSPETGDAVSILAYMLPLIAAFVVVTFKAKKKA